MIVKALIMLGALLLTELVIVLVHFCVVGDGERKEGADDER